MDAVVAALVVGVSQLQAIVAAGQGVLDHTWKSDEHAGHGIFALKGCRWLL